MGICQGGMIYRSADAYIKMLFQPIVTKNVRIQYILPPNPSKLHICWIQEKIDDLKNWTPEYQKHMQKTSTPLKFKLN